MTFCQHSQLPAVRADKRGLLALAPRLMRWHVVMTINQGEQEETA